MSYNPGKPLRTSTTACNIKVPVGTPLKCWMGLGTEKYLGASVSISVKWVTRPHFGRGRRGGSEESGPQPFLPFCGGEMKAAVVVSTGYVLSVRN